ncbi:non-canonical purine NTP diphosphatase [Muriicola sp.]|uniref:non-canonical purine NTP diphosphatase n=1 Tax=Muriicola sp. TaxID=2020856 RepID=UPI003C709008
MEFVFATHNEHKLEEIRDLLPKGIMLKSLNELGCKEEIAETSETLEGNARLKANYVMERYGLPCFADDTGLEVVALNGAPGVYSARYAGEPKNESRNIEKLLQHMSEQTDRRAQFTTVIALNLGQQTHIFYGIIPGIITMSPRGHHGFGYDAVFQPDGLNKTFAELSLKEKNQLSHRALAFSKLVNFLKKV